MIMESMFSLPGLGRLMVTALEDRDYPVVSGINLVRHRGGADQSADRPALHLAGPAGAPRVISPETTSQPRVQEVSDRIAQHIDAVDYNTDSKTRPYGHPRSQEHIRASRTAEHTSPASVTFLLIPLI